MEQLLLMRLRMQSISLQQVFLTPKETFLGSAAPSSVIMAQICALGWQRPEGLILQRSVLSGIAAPAKLPIDRTCSIKIAGYQVCVFKISLICSPGF